MIGNASHFFVHDNTAEGQFELRDRRVDREDVVSFATYKRHGNTVVVPHVQTDTRRRGEGLADQLMAGLLDQIEAASRFIVPLCPFAAQRTFDRAERSHLLAPEQN